MKVKSVVLFLLLVVFTTFFLYCVVPLSLDSTWNYGFAYNILDGLIPYRDYNMVITPLFCYLVAFVLAIMGNNFLVYYILTSVLMAFVTFLAYRKIGIKALLIHFFLMIYPHNGYNLFGVFLIFILFYILEKDYKYKDLLVAFVVSCMFLSKQTLGLLVIPSIIYSKNKKKIIAFYGVVILLFGLYLVCYNNLFEFIDYCLLGMFDFGGENTTEFSILTLIEILICIYFGYQIFKSKFDDKEAFYVLLFQIISFPITDGSHFALSFAPVIYYLFVKYNNDFRFKYLFTVLVLFYIIGSGFALRELLKFDDMYYNESSVFNYKKMPNYMNIYTNIIKEYSSQYPNHRMFLLDSRAYIAKLDMKLKIDKYDLINEGNMGYKGHIKYVEEIDRYCKENDCIFIVNELEVKENINQTSEYITHYVDENYKKIYSSNIDSIYIN